MNRENNFKNDAKSHNRVDKSYKISIIHKETKIEISK
jgi:hypothetical protein